MQDLTIALVQANPVWHNIEKNLKEFTALFIRRDIKAEVIVLPEMFSTGFTMASQAMAEKMHGRTHNWLQYQAADLNMVICGSIIVEENGNYFNRFLWVEPDGTTTAYDKRHLFRMAEENKYFSEGTKQVDISYKGWKIRPQICYDLRFPVYARNTITQGEFDYDILLYVANWPQTRVNAWDILLSARAIENHAYCVGVNRVGEDDKGVIYNGHSAAYNYKGEPLCRLEEKEGIETITFSKANLLAYRKQFPAYLDADTFNLA
jgi:omega-amidase